jgi:ribosomal-protein-alanine N-acetyltransferase
MLALTTRRMQLIAATHDMAVAALGDRARLAHLLSATLPRDWPPPLNDEASALWFADQLARHPDAVGWMMWYFVLDQGDGRTAIGNGGFKGEPRDGAVEIGYSIVPAFQSRGFATEAARALAEWAFGHDSVDRVIAQTLPESTASQALLSKLGFRRTGGADEPGVLRFEKLKRPPSGT